MGFDYLNKLTIKDYVFIVAFLAFFRVIIYWINTNSDQDRKDSLKEHAFTVGKTFKYSFNDGFNNFIDYKYFVNGKKNVGHIDLDSHKNLPLNKYYKVKYSITKPEISEIYLEQEIKDSLEIFKAGFNNKKHNELFE